MKREGQPTKWQGATIKFGGGGGGKNGGRVLGFGPLPLTPIKDNGKATGKKELFDKIKGKVLFRSSMTGNLCTKRGP